MVNEPTEAGFYAMDLEPVELPFAWTEDAIHSAGADVVSSHPALIDKLEAMQAVRGPTGHPLRPTWNALKMLNVPVGYDDAPLAAVVAPLIDDVIVYIRTRQPKYVLLSREPCKGPQLERLARELASRREAG